MQLVMDSKHRVKNLNFLITALALIDKGTQFRLISIAVSNKEDSTVYKNLLQKTMEFFDPHKFKSQIVCTQSDNCAAIQSAFRAVLQRVSLGKCLFHLMQNNHRKRDVWSNVPPNVSAEQKRSAWIPQRRNELERQGRDTLAWLSKIPDNELFLLVGNLFRLHLISKGQDEYARFIEECFESGKYG